MAACIHFNGAPSPDLRAIQTQIQLLLCGCRQSSSSSSHLPPSLRQVLSLSTPISFSTSFSLRQLHLIRLSLPSVPLDPLSLPSLAPLPLELPPKPHRLSHPSLPPKPHRLLRPQTPHQQLCHPPFDCGCFDWVCRDASPNRGLIHQAIDLSIRPSHPAPLSLSISLSLFPSLPVSPLLAGLIHF